MSGQERGGESPPPSRSNPEQLDNPKGGSGAMSQNDTDQQHDANKRTLEVRFISNISLLEAIQETY